MLADGSKLGRIELAHLCPIEAVDMLITGDSADPDVVDALSERGCEVVIAGLARPQRPTRRDFRNR